MEGKSKLLKLMAAFKINQKAKTIHKNKKLKMMLQVARIDISKRKNFLASISKSNLFALCNGKKEQSTWKFNREENWFEDIWRNRQSNQFQIRWRQDVRMNGVNFEKLVALVQPNLEKQDTNLRKAVPMKKRVGVTLWRLATGNYFRSVAKTFAIGKSTGVKIIHEFCDEIVRISSNFIKFLQSQIETGTATELFKSDCNGKIPQTVSAIDGTHIFIQTPGNERKFDYYCRKQRHSINA